MLDYQNIITSEIVSKDYFKVINSDVEGFIKYKDYLIRICLLKLTEEEKKNLKI